MPVKVKICGIRTLQAAQTAMKAGADFLGFNFVPTSKRYISPADAAKIINVVRGKVKIVGVFQNETITNVNKIAKELNLDFVQLHGNEDKMYIKQIENNINAVYFLLDRLQRKGKMVDLKKASQIAAKTNLFYAGGLTSSNVANVIKKVRPFAVDVASGVETNGQQDLEKIKLFVKNAKGASL